MTSFLRSVGIVAFCSIWATGAWAETSTQCDDDGCTVTTCDDTWCEVWYCADGTCTHIGTYPTPGGGGTTPPPDGLNNGSAIGKNGIEPYWQMSGPTPGRPRVMHCGEIRCAIRMCNDQECSVIGFEDGMAFDIVRYPNTQGAADKLVSTFLEDGSSSFSVYAIPPRGRTELFRQD